VAHRETKEVTGYQLTVAPDGPKQLTPAAPVTGEVAPASPNFAPMGSDAEGFPILRPGGTTGAINRGGTMRMTFRRVQMLALAQQLRSVLTRSGDGESVPVIDATGIKGLFDFHLAIPSPPLRLPLQGRQGPGSSATTAGDPNVGPNEISAALENQLGLTLYPVVTKMPVVVVEQVNPVPADH
jgi:uncharacterized protein (TIGR03435 family)